MKRPTSKLTLNREILCQLDRPELTRAVGGSVLSVKVQCPLSRTCPQVICR